MVLSSEFEGCSVLVSNEKFVPLAPPRVFCFLFFPSLPPSLDPWALPLTQESILLGQDVRGESAEGEAVL